MEVFSMSLHLQDQGRIAQTPNQILVNYTTPVILT